MMLCIWGTLLFSTYIIVMISPHGIGPDWKWPNIGVCRRFLNSTSFSPFFESDTEYARIEYNLSLSMMVMASTFSIIMDTIAETEYYEYVEYVYECIEILEDILYDWLTIDVVNLRYLLKGISA